MSTSEIRCTEPVLAEHGILSVTGNDRMYGRTLIRTGTAENSNTGATSYKIGALVKYRCERGYKVVGEPLSTCEENGKWSGEVPQCVCKCISRTSSHSEIAILQINQPDIREKLCRMNNGHRSFGGFFILSLNNKFISHIYILLRKIYSRCF